MYRTNIRQLWLHPYNQQYKIQKYVNSKVHCLTNLRKIHVYTDRTSTFQTGFKTVNQSTRKFSSTGSFENKKSNAVRNGVIILTTTAIGGIVLVYLTQTNDDLRETIEKWIPGSDQILSKENFSMFKNVYESLQSAVNSITNLFGTDEVEKSDHTTKPLNLKEMTEKKPEPKSTVVSPPLTTTSVKSSENLNKTKVADTKKDASSVPSLPVSKALPQEPLDLVNQYKKIATEAINSYNNAIKEINTYNNAIIKILNENTASFTLPPIIWEKLKVTIDKKKSLLSESEKRGSEAIAALKSTLSSLDKTQSSVRENIMTAIDEISEAKRKYEKEKGSIKITEQFWDRVKIARENFNHELRILFPNLYLHDEHHPVNLETLDLFVLYMFNKVNYLHTELEKLEIIGSEKLKAALNTAKGQDQEKLNELVHREIQKERRQLQEEFNKTLLVAEKEFLEKLKKQLTLQAHVHNDQMKETIELREREIQTAVQHTLNEELEKESAKFKSQIAVLVGRLRGLDDALKIRLSEEKGTSEAQLLWTACQALANSLDRIPNDIKNKCLSKPLKEEMKIVSNLAPKADNLVETTLAAIPDEAAKRGVYPEVALRSRFLQVEQTARRLALIPEEGASMFKYMLSYLQNFFIRKIDISSSEELDDKPIDISKFDTYDILNRARYWIDRGNLKMALRYMNLLKGASRSVAREWMNETRILLETKQAVDILIAYTGAISLLFISPDDKKMSN